MSDLGTEMSRVEKMEHMREEQERLLDKLSRVRQEEGTELLDRLDKVDTYDFFVWLGSQYIEHHDKILDTSLLEMLREYINEQEKE